MVNPVLLSPISNHHATPTPFISHSFNPSTNSSIAPTPVPSEFNDFGPIGACDGSTYLLDVEPLVDTDQAYLLEDKEMIPENLSNIFDILNEEPAEILVEETVDKEATTDSNSMMLESLPNANLSDRMLLEESNELLAGWTNGTSVAANTSSARARSSAGESASSNHASCISAGHDNPPKIVQSRSYPNTPLPLPNSSFAVQYPEDSNASRSYPTTPLHNLQQQQQNYSKSNEPMLFSPTLNSLNLHSQTASIGIAACPTSVECNVADFLNRDLPNDEADDLGSLGHFEGLQDVGALSPLFTEVVESNH